MSKLYDFLNDYDDSVVVECIYDISYLEISGMWRNSAKIWMVAREIHQEFDIPIGYSVDIVKNYMVMRAAMNWVDSVEGGNNDG